MDESLLFRNAYCCPRHGRCDMIVKEKNRTDVRGHMTYVLMGVAVDDESVRFSTLVSREQWERYDVPIAEKKITKKVNRIYDMQVSLNKYRAPKMPDKDKRKVENKRIEKWLADHYGIDLESLDGLDESIIEGEVPKRKRRKKSK